MGAAARDLVDSGVARLAARAAVLLARDGLRGAVTAKRGSLQSYSHHAIAVASAAAKMAEALAEKGIDVVGVWAELEPRLMGFLAGLVHDHNKAWGRGEHWSLLRLIKGLLEGEVVLEDRGVESLLRDLYAVAEAAEQGFNTATVASGQAALAAVTALADILASSTSLAEAYTVLKAPEQRYRYGLDLLRQNGYEFKTLLATRPGLAVLEAAVDVAEEAARRGCRGILVYHDGLLLLCPKEATVEYRVAAEAVARRLLSIREANNTGIARIEKSYKKAMEYGLRAKETYGLLTRNDDMAEKLVAELRRSIKDFITCGEKGGKASDCGLEGYVVGLASLLAAERLYLENVIALTSRAKRVFGKRLQKNTVFGQTNGPIGLTSAIKVFGAFLSVYLENLVKEGRLGEAAGFVAALVAGESEPGRAEARLLARAAGLNERKAAQLLKLKAAGFPVVLGLLLRAVHEDPSELVKALEEETSGLDAGEELRKFAFYYACSSLGGTLLSGKECKYLKEPEVYCSVCRAPLPSKEAGFEFPEYGRRLGLPRKVSELWSSDEPPLIDIQKNDIKSVTGTGRLVCPACLYEAGMIAEGLGLAEQRRRALTLLVYTMHPVASPEQLAVAAELLDSLSPPGTPDKLSRLAEDAAEKEASLSENHRLLVDFTGARVLVHPEKAGLDGYIDQDKLLSTTPSLQHAAALLYTLGPLLGLLGGQVALASSLASRQPRSIVSAGRPLLYVEEALQRYGYRGAVVAMLSFAARAEPLVEGARASERPRLLKSYLVQLEGLAAWPEVAALVPPRPGLMERSRREPGGGLYTGLLDLIRIAMGGGEVSRLLEALKRYSLAMCCLARQLSKSNEKISRHAVQGPLREALRFIIDFQGIVDRGGVIKLATGRAVDAARRRLGDPGSLEQVLRDSIETVALELQQQLPQLAPGKARELVEALLDTAYMLFSDCWRSSKEEKEERCRKLAPSS